MSNSTTARFKGLHFNNETVFTFQQSQTGTRRDLFFNVDDHVSKKSPFSLAVVKITGFESIIQRVGYLQSEVLIDKVSDRLIELISKNINNQFLLAKYQAGAFGILIKNKIDGEGRKRIVDAIQQDFTFTLFDNPSHVTTATLRVGLTSYHSFYIPTDEVLRDTEACLEASANSPIYNEPEKHEFTKTDLELAIHNNELKLWFQKKVNLKPGYPICGYESLIRWCHPTMGLLSPSDFLSSIKNHSLNNSFNNWVINKAFQTCREQLDLGNPLPIAINLDASSLEDIKTFEIIAAALKKFAVPTYLIEFEIIETVEISKNSKMHLGLEKLKALGYKLSIDDFGTGSNNIAYLMFLPVDTIKLDRVFCSTIANPQTLALTKAAVAMAKASKLSVVAEGIETSAQAKLMTEIGCEIGQGFYFGRPQNAI